jgi:hypothetical protein
MGLALGVAWAPGMGWAQSLPNNGVTTGTEGKDIREGNVGGFIPLESGFLSHHR